MADKEAPKFSGVWHGAVFINGMSEGIMAVSKEIKGKVDNSAHDGKRAELRRLAESDDVITTFWTEIYHAAEDGTLESEEGFHPVPDELATE